MKFFENFFTPVQKSGENTNETSGGLDHGETDIEKEIARINARISELRSKPTTTSDENDEIHMLSQKLENLESEVGAVRYPR